MTALAGATATRAGALRRPSAVVRRALIAVAVLFIGVFLVAPLVALVREAFADGLAAYLAALGSSETFTALRLSLLVTLLAVPLNVVFGVSAAWAITKHDFRGKSLLITLIDLPFSVSPVIAGLVFVLLFGRHGVFGDLLFRHDVKVIFALPGIVLATVFVTFPMVARELIPLMEAQGREEELAAHVLGAGGWTMFWRVTLPNIRLGVLYGVIVSAARAMGEFGAVSVVSGHIRGETNTLPLHIEVLYNEYDFVGAFAAATLLTLFALVSLGLKTWLEWRGELRLASAASRGGADGDQG